jgi:hypothetical protein
MPVNPWRTLVLRWCRGAELDRRHTDFQACDLPLQAIDKSGEPASLAGVKLAGVGWRWLGLDSRGHSLGHNQE